MQPDFFQKEFRKARKQHKCCECGEKILVGEKYMRNFGIYDGDASNYKVCGVCEWVRDTLDMDSDDDMFTELWENVGYNGYDFSKEAVIAKFCKDKNEPFDEKYLPMIEEVNRMEKDYEKNKIRFKR
jgi:hypothetical protein